MLLSRAADGLYWISRYLERAEHTARLMDVRLDLGLDRRSAVEGWDFERLFAALRVSPSAEIPSSPGTLIDTLVFDGTNPDSVFACATAALVDLHFSDDSRLPSNHVEWVGLLRSCSALEAYCRCYTADLRPDRIAEFLLLNPDFPRSVRFSAARVESALRTIAQLTGRGTGGRPERLAGRLHASLDYGQVDEILSEDPHAYLDSVAA
jgi:uncharacterized alpha-E superfamily protein